MGNEKVEGEGAKSKQKERAVKKRGVERAEKLEPENHLFRSVHSAQDKLTDIAFRQITLRVRKGQVVGAEAPQLSLSRPVNILHRCHLLSRWFLAWIILRY
jgi:hypothetical protein